MKNGLVLGLSGAMLLLGTFAQIHAMTTWKEMDRQRGALEAALGAMSQSMGDMTRTGLAPPAELDGCQPMSSQWNNCVLAGTDACLKYLAAPVTAAKIDRVRSCMNKIVRDCSGEIPDAALVIRGASQITRQDTLETLLVDAQKSTKGTSVEAFLSERLKSVRAWTPADAAPDAARAACLPPQQTVPATQNQVQP